MLVDHETSAPNFITIKDCINGLKIGATQLGYLGPVEIAISSLTATAGVLILSVSCIGWLLIPLNIVERIVACVAALFLMFSGWRTDLIGLGLFCLLLAYAYARYRRAQARGEAPRYIGGDMVDDDVEPAPRGEPPGD